MKIYPSLISADILNISSVVSQFNHLSDGYHIDIMDGHFVPSITWGPLFSNAIAKKTDLPLHIHLMVSDPACIAARLSPRQQDYIIFHYEAIHSKQDLIPTIKHLKNMRCHVGMAINPETPLQDVTLYFEHLDALLIMAVAPGVSGQQFISIIMEKITSLVQLRSSIKPNLSLIVDGGVGEHNIASLAMAGIDACAVASAIFSTFNPESAVKQLRLMARSK